MQTSGGRCLRFGIAESLATAFALVSCVVARLPHRLLDATGIQGWALRLVVGVVVVSGARALARAPFTFVRSSRGRYLAEPSRAVVVTAKALACALSGALLALFTLQIALLLMCVFGSPGATLGLTGGKLSSAWPARWPASPSPVCSGWESAPPSATDGCRRRDVDRRARRRTGAHRAGAFVADLLPSGAASAAAGNAGAVGWMLGLALSVGYAAAAAITGGYLCSRADV